MSEARAWPVSCRIHSGRPAIARCTACGDFVCASCRAVEPDGRARCERCHRGDSPASVPFEGRGRFVTRFFATAREVFLTPRPFMARLDPHGRLLPAFLFAWLAATLGRIISFLWYPLLFSDPFYDMLRDVAEQTETSTQMVLVWILTAATPLVAAMSVSLGFMLLYLGVLFAGVPQPYNLRGYARMVSYAGAANLLWVVPVLGPFLAIWTLSVICWHGLRAHHDLAPRRALLAVVPLAAGLLLFEMSHGM